MAELNISKKNLTYEQKIGFVLLLFFGILTIFLGLLQMRNTIYNPFVIRPKNITLNTTSFLDDMTRLQQVDTDQDSLTDFDELEFYMTSPYLPDTDSDGINDNIEIENGTDPLCPQGETCGAPEAPESASVIEPPPLEENPFDFLDSLTGAIADSENLTGLETAEKLNAQTLFNNPQTVRQLLLSTGQFTSEQLAQITDEEITQMIQELMNSE